MYSKFFIYLFFSVVIFSIVLAKKVSLKSERFSINISTNGTYSISVNGSTWLDSAETFLRANYLEYGNYDSGLLLDNTVSYSGTDVLGRRQTVQFDYSLLDDTITKMNCSITTYSDLNLIRFTQYFPSGTRNSAVQDFDTVITGFPNFRIKTIQNEKRKHLDIGYLSFGGMMAGDMEKQYGRWNSLTLHINDGIAGGPLIIFNPITLDTLIISQMTEFMVGSMRHNQLLGGSLSYGIMGGINEVPSNYSLDFLVYYSNNGINKAMEEWGSILLKFYNKNTNLKYNDITQTHLSYWTDNGAYYYWLTEDGKDYQTTMLDVVDYSIKNGIPYRTLQYDSWWYGARKGYREGCFRWNGNIPSIRFPDTLEYVWNKTGLPITAHNKFWDISVEYATENGGSYEFIIDEFGSKSLPIDPQFWMDLFANATRWGLKTYEQDWLNHQTLDYTPLMTNITLGKTWLKQMGRAALANNITLQYCMSLPRHVLQSLEIDAVTQIRVTNDYATNFQYGGEQWRLGVSSIFAASLGLSPFKDVYWTTANQTGNPYGPKAVDPKVRLNSLVSTLTAGPVGPGDKIGTFMNKELIMRSCNEDGLLLKPSRPVTSINEQIYNKAFGKQYAYGVNGEVWTTYSNIDGFTFGVIFATSMSGFFVMTERNVGFDVSDKSYYWEDANKTEVHRFNGQNDIRPLVLGNECDAKEFCLYHVTPSFNINNNSISILGEQAKWVPVSPQRINSIRLGSNNLMLSLNGALNEKVVIAFYINKNYTNIECNFVKAKQMTIKIDLTSTININCS